MSLIARSITHRMGDDRVKDIPYVAWEPARFVIFGPWSHLLCVLVSVMVSSRGKRSLHCSSYPSLWQ